MQKIIVIQSSTLGVYGTDIQGNPWCSFLLGRGVTVDCRRCGTKISSGYKRGMLGEEDAFCDSHIQWIYPEEDNTGKTVTLEPLA